MYVWQRWMAEEFRKAGLTVHEVAGWKNRGRPASVGGFNPTAGILVHHTASTSSASNPHPTLRMLIEGRSDLPGPLCHWMVDYKGEVWVIAAGRANHAGRSDKKFAGVPIGSDGNYFFMGDEVDTNGTQPLSSAQRRSITITDAVYLDHMRNRLDTLGRHADITTRKWDIGSISTATLRSDVEKYRQEKEDMPLTDAEFTRIKKMIEDEGTTTRTMIQNLMGDVVDSDPTVWGDPPTNTKVYARTALARILDRLGKGPSQP